MKMTAQKMLKKRREKAAKEKAASQGAAAGAAKKTAKEKVTGTGGMYVGSGDNKKLNITKEQLDKSGMTLTGYANYMNRNDGKRPTGETKTSPQAKPKAGTRGQMGRADRRPKVTKKEDKPKVKSNELPLARRKRMREERQDAAKTRAATPAISVPKNPRSARPTTTGTPTPSQGTMARSAARGNPAPTTPDTPDMLPLAKRRQQRGMKGGGMAKKGYAKGGMSKKGYKKGGAVRGAGIAKKGVRKCKMR